MAFRKALSRKASRKSFRRGAVRVHKKNVSVAAPMRGGYRL